METGKILILCLGSPSIECDSFGPRVGTLLASYYYSDLDIDVIGTMEEPVQTAAELSSVINIIEEGNYKFIISVDAALHDNEHICSTVIVPEGIKPGTASGLDTPYLGDVGYLLCLKDAYITTEVRHLMKYEVFKCANAIMLDIDILKRNNFNKKYLHITTDVLK